MIGYSPEFISPEKVLEAREDLEKDKRYVKVVFDIVVDHGPLEDDDIIHWIHEDFDTLFCSEFRKEHSPENVWRKVLDTFYDLYLVNVLFLTETGYYGIMGWHDPDVYENV